MMRFCPSTYPSSRRPSRNASTRLASRDGEEFPRYPIVTVRPVLDSVSLAARGTARRPRPRARTMRRHNGLRLEKNLTVLPPPTPQSFIGAANARGSPAKPPASTVRRTIRAVAALSGASTDSGKQARWLPSRLIPHRHRSRAELQPAHELQVDTLR